MVKFLNSFSWGLILVLTLSCIGVAQTLPVSAPHPQPLPLASWSPDSKTGDYFDQIKPTSVGYLVWSTFPLKVYWPLEADPGWIEAVQQSVQDWSQYLELTSVSDPTSASIVFEAVQPPVVTERDPDTGQLKLGPARAGLTSYRVYLSKEFPPRLCHTMTIQISPGKAPQSLLATARHELGHGLGIWGHSTNPQDVLYPTGGSHLNPISGRDINTLFKIYQQPTQLGWRVMIPPESNTSP